MRRFPNWTSRWLIRRIDPLGSRLWPTLCEKLDFLSTSTPSPTQDWVLQQIYLLHYWCWYCCGRISKSSCWYLCRLCYQECYLPDWWVQGNGLSHLSCCVWVDCRDQESYLRRRCGGTHLEVYWVHPMLVGHIFSGLHFNDVVMLSCRHSSDWWRLTGLNFPGSVLRARSIGSSSPSRVDDDA